MSMKIPNQNDSSICSTNSRKFNKGSKAVTSVRPLESVNIQMMLTEVTPHPTLTRLTRPANSFTNA